MFIRIIYIYISYITKIVFLVGMKVVAAAICMLPLGGCALGVGLIFCGLLYGISRNPSAYDSVFGLSLLGLAMIELFAFICVIAAGAAYLL
jgi:F0F1-type ATP synthase membrane subunit c/vacuolar-type H+-ATPase subunit K